MTVIPHIIPRPQESTSEPVITKTETHTEPPLTGEQALVAFSPLLIAWMLILIYVFFNRKDK